jgi:hypothetical protein
LDLYTLFRRNTTSRRSSSFFFWGCLSGAFGWTISFTPLILSSQTFSVEGPKTSDTNLSAVFLNLRSLGPRSGWGDWYTATKF